VRRALRRILRPIFVRQVDIYQDLYSHIDAMTEAGHGLRGELSRMNDRLESSLALAWDQAAYARRLAALEDRVEALMQAAETHRPDLAQMLLPFPELTASPRTKAG
jgi:hypothetical protein